LEFHYVTMSDILVFKNSYILSVVL